MNASGAELAKRSAATRVNGIGEKIALGCLNQKCGVIDPCCERFACGKGRARRRRGYDVTRPARGAAREFPAQNLMKPWTDRTIGIEENVPVAVVRKGERSRFHFLL